MNAYSNEYDTYIAEDLDDLRKLLVEEEKIYGYDEFDEEVDKWEELDPSAELTIIDDPTLPRGDWIRETKTIAEWIDLRGRGLLCSTEW